MVERSFVEAINCDCDEIFQSSQNQVASVLGSGLTRLKCSPGSSVGFTKVELGLRIPMSFAVYGSVARKVQMSRSTNKYICK